MADHDGGREGIDLHVVVVQLMLLPYTVLFPRVPWLAGLRGAPWLLALCLLVPQVMIFARAYDHRRFRSRWISYLLVNELLALAFAAVHLVPVLR